MAHKKTSDQISYNMSRIKNKNTAIELQFEEELKKFRPSPEIDQVEDNVYKNNLADVTDLLDEMLKEIKNRQ